MLKILIFLVFFISLIDARKHHLEIRNDIRQYISLSSFGFYKQGRLTVRISKFKLVHGFENKIFGLSLEKSISDAVRQNTDLHQDQCFLEENISAYEPALYIVMNFQKEKVDIRCSQNWHNTDVYEEFKIVEHIEPVSYKNGSYECNIKPLTLAKNKVDDTYEFTFVMFVNSTDDEGIYNLYFHACPNYDPDPSNTFILNFNVDLEEINNGNYLSSSEMPLPNIYLIMSVLHLLSGIFWMYTLRESKHPVFKIHRLMSVLVFLKSLSLMLHSINFHFIATKGENVETWAVLYYIIHLIKGVCLYTTIVLISIGWSFIKQALDNKDKIFLVIVIPLQVLANIAEIFFIESERGSLEQFKWREIFILVDLLCCAAILFPIVRSIRNFQASSLKKLFRHFLIMIVCYVYFTRIIAFLLKITLSFEYAWMDELFIELATYTFFILTAYKFRPIALSPYSLT